MLSVCPECLATLDPGFPLRLLVFGGLYDREEVRCVLLETLRRRAQMIV
jgi:hypothetical protein